MSKATATTNRGMSSKEPQKGEGNGEAQPCFGLRPSGFGFRISELGKGSAMMGGFPLALLFAVAGAGLVLLAAGPASAAPLARFTVEAGPRDRQDVPLEVPVSLPKVPVRLEEVAADGRRAVPFQLSQPRAEGPLRLAWVLSGKTLAGARRTFELVPGEPPPMAGGVHVRQDAEVLTVECGGATVLQYNHAVVPPPEGQDPRYARSGFIHPLRSPGGQALTAIHPKDHIHHMGLWNAWVHTEFEGRKPDFWNLKGGTGLVRFVRFAWTASGPVFGGFRAVQEQVDLKAPGGGKVALTEDYDVRVWRPGDDRKAFLADVVIADRCATASPLKLPAYRYGGFGFRATEKWNKASSDYLTSEAKTRTDGHGTRSRWCIIQGRTDEGPAGILFMSHPENREHPEPMRIWPNGPIFFNYCPIQKTDWTLEPGKEYVLRYRLCVYDGSLDAAAAEALWQDYAAPPKVNAERGTRNAE